MIVPKIINKDKTIKLKITSYFPNIVLANLQEKNVTPSKEIQEVVADEMYDGLSKVIVNPIPDIKLQEKSSIPTKEKQELIADVGYDALSKVTIEPIPNEYIIPNGTLEIIENGEYDVTEKSKVNVQTPISKLGTKTISENGIYNAIEDNLDGYSSVEVATTGVDITNYFNEEISGSWETTVKKLPPLKLKTSVTDCSNMFADCTSSELDLSQFDTSNVTNMGGMFRNCTTPILNLLNFNTNKVTSMGNMFNSCLANEIKCNFDISNVTGFLSMFNGANKVEELDLSSWTTTKTTSMNGMFGSCTSLKRLDLRNFNTSNITNMYQTFLRCTSLEYLDIRNFDFTNVTSYTGMFGSSTTPVPANCLIIVKDDTARNWITSKFNWLTNIKTIAEL